MADFRAYMFFTFHNVSIKTSNLDRVTRHCNYFTFHNVSIKTLSGMHFWHLALMLYIPQCFY